METKHDFLLSVDEADYLNRLASHEKLLLGLLKSAEEADGRKVRIRLSRDEAENVREFLTTKLAEVGFDENYSPNAEGRVLEKLIDKFCVS